MSKLKNRKQVTTSIDIRLLEQLDELSRLTRIDKSKLFDEAIEYLVEKYDLNRLIKAEEARQKYKVDKME
jgi:metal-responsive CopG/Arc/MetJ family transcriptional regulator